MNAPVEQSWGAYRLWIRLPGLSIQLTGLSDVQLASLKESYPRFITEQDNEPAERAIKCSAYRLKRLLAIPTKALTRDGQYAPLQIRQQDIIRLTGCNFKAQFELNQSNSMASLGVAEENELAQADVIENFLRIYAAHHTLRQGGLILHSAGLVFDGQTYIFPGRSNAGKTTLTRKAYKHGARVLSDDINLLLPGKDGYQAHAVPFTGEFGHTLDHSGGQDAYPVAGIILLEQGADLITKTVTTADAVATLLTGCPFVNTDAEESSHLFDAVIKLVATLPVIRLISSRDDDVEAIMAAVTKEFQSITG